MPAPQSRSAGPHDAYPSVPRRPPPRTWPWQGEGPLPQGARAATGRGSVAKAGTAPEKKACCVEGIASSPQHHRRVGRPFLVNSRYVIYGPSQKDYGRQTRYDSHDTVPARGHRPAPTQGVHPPSAAGGARAHGATTCLLIHGWWRWATRQRFRAAGEAARRGWCRGPR